MEHSLKWTSPRRICEGRTSDRRLRTGQNVRGAAGGETIHRCGCCMVGSCFVVGCVCSWELDFIRFNARIESRISLAPPTGAEASATTNTPSTGNAQHRNLPSSSLRRVGMRTGQNLPRSLCRGRASGASRAHGVSRYQRCLI